MDRTRAKGLAVVALACAAMAAMAGASSAAAAKWVIHGRGFGHGVGMSQYGAYGYAKHGRDYKSILKHYYRHTRIGNADGSVKVLLASGRGSVGFANAHKACGKRLHRGRGYAFAESGSRVILESGRGRRITKCGRSGTAKGGHGIQVSGKGTYRGKLIAKASGGLLVVNKVSLDDYTRGVVANEMPSSWPQNALRAQAVAARSFGLSSHAGHGFNVYDDTRSQVYAGKGSETKATNKAVRETSGQILRYHSRPSWPSSSRPRAARTRAISSRSDRARSRTCSRSRTRTTTGLPTTRGPSTSRRARWNPPSAASSVAA